MPRRRKQSAVKKKAKPPAGGARAGMGLAPAPPAGLRYKVVELSNVDEGAIERAVNEWVAHGWAFDGVQFAMRESSKRPSMAFVFFTRAAEPTERAAENDAFREAEAADAHLRRIVLGPDATVPQRSATDAWARLAELADVARGDDDGDERR